MYKGFLLVVEGIGGSGKTTLTKKAAKFFEDAKIPYVLTFEPGGTPAANVLRKLCREGIEGCEPLTPMAEALLFNAARAQHTEIVIKPALEAGKVVICDRYMLTTLVYQGNKGCSWNSLRNIHQQAIGLYPDLTLVMTGDAEVFMSRVSEAERSSDKFDALALGAQERMQESMEWAVKHMPNHVGIKADIDEDQVFAQVLPILMSLQSSINKRPDPIPSIKVPKVDLKTIVPGRVENLGIKDTSVPQAPSLPEEPDERIDKNYL